MMLSAPLAAWVEAGVRGGYGGPTLLLGMTAHGEWLGVTDDGRFAFFPIGDVVTDWRFDWAKHDWTEVRDIGDEQEPSDDGGSYIPGPVPTPDGAGVGNPINEEGGPSAGGPGGVDAAQEDDPSADPDY